MATMTQKLNIYKAANATTYTANIYTTAAEALNSPLRVNVNGTTGYIAASTNPPTGVALPLYVQKNGTTYQAMVSGYQSGDVTYTSSGIFTVPSGVYIIYVTASAGGGGGGGAANSWPLFENGGNGGAGGNTALGNLLWLQGGGGGGGAMGEGDGKAGAAGASYSNVVVHYSFGGGGAGGIFTGSNAARCGGNGGRGANCSNVAINVTPGQVLSVNIGGGGAGGGGATNQPSGSWGQQGYMYIRW